MRTKRMANQKAEVPAVDVRLATDEPATANHNAFEFRLLEAEAKARENLNREADQRYRLRWIAVFVVLGIIAMIALLLNHIAHWLPDDSKSTGAVIALHLAPIISMTTLAIALLVAAFRGFKEGDDKFGTSNASDAVKASGMGSM